MSLKDFGSQDLERTLRVGKSKNQKESTALCWTVSYNAWFKQFLQDASILLYVDHHVLDVFHVQQGSLCLMLGAEKAYLVLERLCVSWQHGMRGKSYDVISRACISQNICSMNRKLPTKKCWERVAAATLRCKKRAREINKSNNVIAMLDTMNIYKSIEARVGLG